MGQPLSVPPGAKIRLADFDARFDNGTKKEQALEEMQRHVEALDMLLYRLYAEGQRALLLVLQGMDTSGKDGTIRHVMHGVNPLSCQVHSFKQPTGEELAHDFLWRVHRETPRRGADPGRGALLRRFGRCLLRRRRPGMGAGREHLRLHDHLPGGDPEHGLLRRLLPSSAQARRH
jgi:hypothetical protein